MSNTVLIDTLHQMFQQGDLITQKLMVHPYELIGDVFIPTIDEIKASLSGETHIAYLLTSQGGDKWSNLSIPQWNYYIEEVHQFEGGGFGQIIGIDRDFVQQYLKMLHYRWEGVVIPGSEIWDKITPWTATYWKTFSIGHRVRFRSDWKQMPEELRGRNAPKWVNEWFRTTVESWYTYHDSSNP
jgi:hypothetical protein